MYARLSARAWGVGFSSASAPISLAILRIGGFSLMLHPQEGHEEEFKAFGKVDPLVMLPKFIDADRDAQWLVKQQQQQQHASEHEVMLGRRFQLQHHSDEMFPPGFFVQLQVRLRRQWGDSVKLWQGAATVVQDTARSLVLFHASQRAVQVMVRGHTPLELLQQLCAVLEQLVRERYAQLTPLLEKQALCSHCMSRTSTERRAQDHEAQPRINEVQPLFDYYWPCGFKLRLARQEGSHSDRNNNNDERTRQSAEAGELEKKGKEKQQHRGQCGRKSQ